MLMANTTRENGVETSRMARVNTRPARVNSMSAALRMASGTAGDESRRKMEAGTTDFGRME